MVYFMDCRPSALEKIQKGEADVVVHGVCSSTQANLMQARHFTRVEVAYHLGTATLPLPLPVATSSGQTDPPPRPRLVCESQTFKPRGETTIAEQIVHAWEVEVISSSGVRCSPYRLWTQARSSWT